MKKRSDIGDAGTTRKRSTAKDRTRSFSPTHEQIAQLAFTLYESRGRQDGRHVEDWLYAEQELLRR